MFCHLKMCIDYIMHIPQYHGSPLLNAVRRGKIDLIPCFHGSTGFSGADGVLHLIAPDVGKADGGTYMDPIYHPPKTRVPEDTVQQPPGC